MLLIALLLAGASPAQGDSTPREVADAAFARADAAMRAQYQIAERTMRQMDAQPKDNLGPAERAGPSYVYALRASQRAWLRFVEAECRVEGYNFRGGSGQLPAVSECRAELTRQRTEQLKGVMK